LRISGHVGADWSNSTNSLCGRQMACLGPTGVWSVTFRCESWHCAVGFCDEMLRQKYIHRIMEDFGLPLVHVFYAYRSERGKDLTSWIKEHVEGGFWRISSAEDCVILSNRKFEGATRLHRLKLKQFLRVELEKPWSRGKRVSFSRTYRRPERVNCPSRVYGLIDEDYAGPFHALRSEIEQARWLFHNRHRMFREYSAVRALLDRYRVFWSQWEDERKGNAIDVAPVLSDTAPMPVRDTPQFQ